MDGMGERSEVVVLGGGLAGLAVAREVARSGRARVTVLEKGAGPGGMARCVHHGDITADLGPHRFYSTMGSMRSWFRETLGGRLFEVERRSRMYVRGGFIPYPPAPWDLLRAFGGGDMMRFGAGWAGARLRGALGRGSEDSFADVMAHQYGRALCEEMVFPYIRKLWRCEPEEISADAARARATMGGVGRLLRRWLGHREAEGQESSLKRFEYARGGTETLVAVLAEGVRAAGGEIVCGADVRGVECAGGRARRVIWRDASGGGERSLGCDFVFSTIPLDALAGCVRGDAGVEGVVAAARGLEYLDVLLVYMVVGRGRISEDTWLYFPQAEPAINRGYEPQNFDRTLVPADRAVLCVEATARPDDGLWMRDAGDLGRDFVGRVARTGLLREGDVIDTFVHRLDHGYPVYRRGYREKRGAVLGALSGLGNLIPLGRQGLFQHNNMDHTIYTALRAAACWGGESDPVGAWHGREIPGFEDFRIVD